MKQKLKDFDLVIGFDTEYTRVDRREESDDELAPCFNGADEPDGVHFLCYSVALFNPATGKRTSSLLNIKQGRSHRWSFAKLIQQAIKTAMRNCIISKVDIRSREEKKQTFRIALVCHYSRADLPGFSDFSGLKTKFDNVRKTFATIQRPHKIRCQLINRRFTDCTIRLFDTRLLAPSGAGSLEKLGDLLGFKKLSVPEVLDETGKSVPGIERMDIVQSQYPKLFEEYALRDAELALEWLVQIDQFRDLWELSNLSTTIGAIAVAKIRQVVGADDFAFFGIEYSEGSKKRSEMQFASGIRNNLSLIANCFHGGRNEAFAHGIFEAKDNKNWQDWDLSGAYTTGMALFGMIDWEAPVHTNELADLTALSSYCVSHVKFSFPKNTRFPSLPVDAGPEGLIFPLEGEAYVTGYELRVAMEQGAVLQILAGLRFEIEPNSSRRPLVDFIQVVNKGRSEHKAPVANSKSPMELLFKECGNSGYGKIAQGIARYKTTSGNHSKKTFDSRTGESTELEESQISNPVFTAMITGLLRAIVSEILANLPQNITVLSVTTDGWLSDASQQEVISATNGPLCSLFRELRGCVSADGSDEIIELKNTAKTVLICKTRGAFTIEPGGEKPENVILAKAGHRLEKPCDSDLETGREFARIYGTRTSETKLYRKDFISFRDQWATASDLIDRPKLAKLSLEYDWKRRPKHSTEHLGLLRFDTQPWNNIGEFRTSRIAFNDWREAGNVCATPYDLSRFYEWRRKGSGKRASSDHSLFESVVVHNWASGQQGFPTRVRGSSKGYSKAEITTVLSRMGVSGITVKKLEKLSSDQESRQVCFEDMTNNDLWLAADILLSLGDEALKTCISNYHECSFAVHRKSINLLEINTLKPFQSPSPKPCIWGRSVRGETNEGGFLKSSCAHLHETAIDRLQKVTPQNRYKVVNGRILPDIIT